MMALSMRALALLVVLVAGCPAQPDFRHDTLGSGSDLFDGGFGSGMAPAQCLIDQDCAAVGAKCCDCPTYAVPTTDPADVACNDVVCNPAPTCPGNVHAACDTGRCVLACTSMVCPASCPQGYALDADGCLTCACAPLPAAPQCGSDPDCVETRADCCGCALGGSDTAVPASQQATFDLGLNCPSSPACPDVNTCEPGYGARCIEGGCVLTTATPSGACGRDDLAACPSGQVCTINVNHAASMQGLGVCQPPT
jgi:hypothetical protein